MTGIAKRISEARNRSAVSQRSISTKQFKHQLNSDLRFGTPKIYPLVLSVALWLRREKLRQRALGNAQHGELMFEY